VFKQTSICKAKGLMPSAASPVPQKIVPIDTPTEFEWHIPGTLVNARFLSSLLYF
jgi:hypothetical protein